MKNYRSPIYLLLFINLMFSLQPVARAQFTALPAGTVHFVGTQNDLLVFEVHFKSALKRGTILRILDQHNSELYAERIDTTISIKRYKIGKNMATRIQFHIRGRGELMKTSFNVNSKLEEKWEITKI